MSKYSGWAIKLTNKDFANDATGDVGPALFATKPAAQAYRKAQFPPGSAVVVRVTVTVKECK